MNEEDLKKIRSAVKEEVIASEQRVINEVGKFIEENVLIELEKHGESLITIESTIKIYGDMYKLNNDDMKKLQKRLETVEDENGINPPPELILSELR